MNQEFVLKQIEYLELKYKGKIISHVEFNKDNQEFYLVFEDGQKIML